MNHLILSILIDTRFEKEFHYRSVPIYGSVRECCVSILSQK
jgi:hypothetical protein